MARQTVEQPAKQYQIVMELAPDESVGNLSITGIGTFTVPQESIVLRRVLGNGSLTGEVLILTPAEYASGGYVVVP